MLFFYSATLYGMKPDETEIPTNTKKARLNRSKSAIFRKERKKQLSNITEEEQEPQSHLLPVKTVSSETLEQSSNSSSSLTASLSFSDPSEKKKDRRKTDKKSVRSPFHKNKHKNKEVQSHKEIESSSSGTSLSSPPREHKEDLSSCLSGEPIKEKELSDIYMDCVVQLFKNRKTKRYNESEEKSNYKEENLSEIAKKIIYSYPFFTHEQHFFTALNKIKAFYPEEIQAVLRELALAAFPNGIDNLKLGLSAFNALKEGLIDDPLLNWDLLKNLLTVVIPNKSPILIEQKKPAQSNIISFCEWKLWDVSMFMNALTARDLALFKAVRPSDFKDFMDNPKNLSESMINLSTHCNKTSEWIALQVLSQKGDEEKRAAIEKFALIGFLLLNENNFNGAMQIYSTFIANRGFGHENLRDNEAYKKLSHAFDIQDNFGNYRSLLCAAQKEKKFYLPYFEILTKDIEIAAALGMPQSFEAIAKTMETFSLCKAKSLPNALDESYLQLVCGFGKIHKETLDVYFKLRNKKPMPHFSQLPDTLTEWTPLIFASVLENNGCADQIGDIFSAGICEGKDIMTYLHDFPFEEHLERLSQLGLNSKVAELLISTLGQ